MDILAKSQILIFFGQNCEDEMMIRDRHTNVEIAIHLKVRYVVGHTLMAYSHHQF